MDSGCSVIGIVGPTGVGKTEIALELAKAFRGEIVSCDSVQLYKHLDIGSAKPTLEQRKTVPHHLVDVFEPDFQVDVGIYKNAAEKEICAIRDSGCLPVICGGTGLYFSALHRGLVEAPSRDEPLRAGLEERADREGLSSLYNELLDSDPVSAGKILPNDKRRIIRALEVLYRTGKPLSELHRDNKKLDLKWIVLGITMDRALLYERIDRRVDRMVADGLVDETRGVMEKFGKDAFALGSIGYRHAKSFLNGEWDRGTFVGNLKRDTRRYAKRQMTWFRKIPDIRWFFPAEKDKMIEAVTEFLNG